MRWEETAAGSWKSGEYRIWLGEWLSQRKYDVSFRGSGKNDWEFNSLAEAQAFARKHARCWRELKWSKQDAGLWVSNCGHYRAIREGRDWSLSFKNNFMEWFGKLGDAQCFAQADSLERALEADDFKETDGNTAMIEPGTTVVDILLEAIGAIANGTEALVSKKAKSVLLVAIEAVQSTWTPTNGSQSSIDSVYLLQTRLGLEVAA